jgi:hypothetical protein
VVENRKFDAFARRIVRAYARCVFTGDVEALPALRDLVSTVDKALRDAAAGLRGFRYSWAVIAAQLGIARQAAQMRWGRTGPDNTFDPVRGAVDADGLVLAVEATWGADASCDGSRRPAAVASAPPSSGPGSAAAERIVSAQLVDVVGRVQEGVQ